MSGGRVRLVKLPIEEARDLLGGTVARDDQTFTVVKGNQRLGMALIGSSLAGVRFGDFIVDPGVSNSEEEEVTRDALRVLQQRFPSAVIRS